LTTICEPYGSIKNVSWSTLYGWSSMELRMISDDFVMHLFH